MVPGLCCKEELAKSSLWPTRSILKILCRAEAATTILRPLKLENIRMLLIMLGGCKSANLLVGDFVKDEGYEEVS